MTQPDSSNDTITNYRDGAKWLVSLGGAAVGGAFTQYEKVTPLPTFFKWIFVSAVFAFLAVTLGAVLQYYWLNRAANQRAKYEEDKTNEAAQKAYQEAFDSIRGLHRILMWSFGIGVVLAGTLSSAVFFAHPQTSTKTGETKSKGVSQIQPASQDSFRVVSSAIHAVGKGRREAHTLLLNQRTGEVWLMVCKSPGVIELRKVRKLDVNGLPDSHAP